MIHSGRVLWDDSAPEINVVLVEHGVGGTNFAYVRILDLRTPPQRTKDARAMRTRAVHRKRSNRILSGVGGH